MYKKRPESTELSIIKSFIDRVKKGYEWNKGNIKIKVIYPGEYSPKIGPDFQHALIKFGSKKIYGDIEIDQNSKDWHRHGHDRNINFDNVILYVVNKTSNITINTYSGKAITVIKQPCSKNLFNRSEATLLKPCNSNIFLKKKVSDNLVWKLNSLGKERFLIKVSRFYTPELNLIDENKLFLFFLPAGAGGPVWRKTVFEFISLLSTEKLLKITPADFILSLKKFCLYRKNFNQVRPALQPDILLPKIEEVVIKFPGLFNNIFEDLLNTEEDKTFIYAIDFLRERLKFTVETSFRIFSDLFLPLMARKSDYFLNKAIKIFIKLPGLIRPYRITNSFPPLIGKIQKNITHSTICGLIHLNDTYCKKACYRCPLLD